MENDPRSRLARVEILFREQCSVFFLLLLSTCLRRYFGPSSLNNFLWRSSRTATTIASVHSTRMIPRTANGPADNPIASDNGREMMIGSPAAASFNRTFLTKSTVENVHTVIWGRRSIDRSNDDQSADVQVCRVCGPTCRCDLCECDNKYKPRKQFEVRMSWLEQRLCVMAQSCPAFF